jgi:hypothetical protein
MDKFEEKFLALCREAYDEGVLARQLHRLVDHARADWEEDQAAARRTGGK